MNRLGCIKRTALLLGWTGIALCANAADDLQGRMETFNLNGPASGMQAEVQVYLPPGYDEAGEPLPVMYFLHGSGGVSGIKILAGFAEEAVRETLCRPFIIVEPRGPNTPQCWWVDAAAIDSKAGTLISRDLIEAVESRYRVMTSREGRIIAGFSMGGFGAMAQLFQHPELYAIGIAYDGGFPEEGGFGYQQERLRERIKRLFGDDETAFQSSTPAGRAAQYAALPQSARPPVDYQLLIGAFGDRIERLQQALQGIGVALPDRIIGAATEHKLGSVLEAGWREHFRYLGNRLGENKMMTSQSTSGTAVGFSGEALTSSGARGLPLQWQVGPSASAEESPRTMVPATVPGAVQYDWGRAQGWPDYWVGQEPDRYQGLEDQYWRYRAVIPEFSLQAGERLLFTAEGVDYQFRILCAGRILHEQEGMFTRAEVDLTETAKPGDLLEVLVFPAPKMKISGGQGRVFFESLKPGVSYGWDFHPRNLVALGIWQEARLEVRPAIDLRRVDVHTNVGDDLNVGELKATLTTSGAKGQTATLSLLDADGQAVWQQEATLNANIQVVTASIPNPELWWPHDQGTPYRYRLRVKLADEVIERSCGFRRVRLVLNKGAEGKPDGGTRPYAAATFEINGRRIFAKGANWVAPNIFYGLDDEKAYRDLLTLARDANMNILRTWGGAPAPKEAFFDICDELGIMVTQDFPLAGGFFPGKPEWLRILDRESRSLIRRISQHPSLAQWCGGNELIIWRRNNEQQLMFRLLNANCFEIDPHTPFIESSPAYGIGHGPYTFWTGWKFLGAQRTGYAEFGAPGAADVETLKKIIPEKELFPPRQDGSWGAHHAKQWLQLETIEQLCGRQESLEQLVANSRMLQAEGLRHAYEETRRQWPFASQSLCWVLNEPWPTAANNSIVGWPCLPKPAYYAVKEALRPQLASARYKKADWNMGEKFSAELWLLNDRPEVLKAGKLIAELRDGDKVLASTIWDFPEVPANTNLKGTDLKADLPQTAMQDFLTLALRVEDRPELASAYRIFLPPANPAPALGKPKTQSEQKINAADPSDTPVQ